MFRIPYLILRQKRPAALDSWQGAINISPPKFASVGASSTFSRYQLVINLDIQFIHPFINYLVTGEDIVIDTPTLNLAIDLKVKQLWHAL